MSWWNIGHGDDVIGDIPADIINHAFKIIAVAYQERGEQKPSLQEALNGIATTLGIRPEEILVDGKGIYTVIAKLESAPDLISDGANEKDDQKLLITLRDAFKTIAKEYEERWQRKPRLRELMSTISFVLRSCPEDYLSAIEGCSIEEIVAELHADVEHKCE